MNQLIEIIFASDLPDCDCGEKWCPKHKKHYYECECLGPSELEEKGYKIIEKDGKLFAEKS